MDIGAHAALAVPKDAIVDIIIGGERDPLDDGGGDDGEEQEGEGDE